MLAILLYHTEYYFTGKVLTNYSLYVTNSLVLFFVISGYLMYKENFEITKKIKSIFRSLLIPYFYFTFIIAIPKALAHGSEFSISEILNQIILGQASWFVAALCLSEFLFGLAIHFTHGNIKLLITISLISFIISSIYFEAKQPFPWQLGNSLQAILFLFIGYIYHKYEIKFEFINKKPIVWCSLLAIFFISVKLFETVANIKLIVWPINIDNYFIFVLDSIICILFMINLSKQLPSCPWLEWGAAHISLLFPLRWNTSHIEYIIPQNRI